MYVFYYLRFSFSFKTQDFVTRLPIKAQIKTWSVFT